MALPQSVTYIRERKRLILLGICPAAAHSGKHSANARMVGASAANLSVADAKNCPADTTTVENHGAIASIMGLPASSQNLPSFPGLCAINCNADPSKQSRIIEYK